DDVSLQVLPPAGGSKATYRFDSPARGEGARRRIAPSPRLREGARRRIASSPACGREQGVESLRALPRLRGRVGWGPPMRRLFPPPQTDRCSIAATLPSRAARRLSRARRLRRTASSSTLTITPSKNASTC